MNYGAAPVVVRNIEITAPEMVFALYMPIRMRDSHVIRVPAHLRAYDPLIEAVIAHAEGLDDHYIYLTVKRLWVEPGALGGRLGWHTDGFGTQDINYIWSDVDPTEFCIQEFILSSDHITSMQEMTEQARPENITQYQPMDLLRLDASNVHRCPESPQSGYRTFVRISLSRDRYDMRGNAHNYEFDYDWEMFERGVVRNDTAKR